MATNIASYIKNFGMSVARSTVDVVKESAPATAGFIDSNQELAKSALYSIKNYKNTISRAHNAFKDSKLYEASDVGFKAILEDAASGKFYNTERSDKLLARINPMFADMGDDFDFDMSFDDSFDESSLTDGDKLLTTAVVASNRDNAEAISNTIVRSNRELANVHKSATNILYVQNQQLLSNVRSSIDNVSNRLDNMTKFDVQITQSFYNNSIKFYDTTTNQLNESNALLKEIATYYKEERLAKEKKNKTSTREKKISYSDIVSFEGAPDLSTYGSAISQNFRKSVSDFGGDMLFGGEGNTLLSFVDSPLKFIPDLIAKTIIGPNILKSAKSFDKTVGSIFGNVVARLNNEAKKDDGSLLGKILGTLFGIDTKTKTSISTGKYEKGAVPFDGIVKKSIVEVIPTYLRQIAAALTDKEEKIYDYESGTFKTATELKRNYKSLQESGLKDAMTDIVTEMAEQQKAIMFNTLQEQKEFQKSFEVFIKHMYDNNGVYNKNIDSYELGIPNDHKKILDRNYYHTSRDAKLQLANKTLISKNKTSKMFTDMEEQSENQYNAVVNGSLNYGKDSSGRSGNINILGTDSYNNDIFFYFQNMYKELQFIRRYSSISSGGTGDEDINSANIDDIRIPKFRDINKIRKNKAEEEAYARSTEKNILDKKGVLLNDYERMHIDAGMSFSDVAFKRDIAREKSEHEDNSTFITEILNEKAKSNEKKYDAKDGGSFLDKLLKAGSMGEKFEVISRGIVNLTQAPAAIFTSVLGKADEAIYNFFFEGDTEKDENGNPIKGFFNKMTSSMKSVFSKLNDWLDENILNPLKDKFNVKNMKGLAKKGLNAMGIDVDAIGTYVKELIQPTKDAVKDKFSGAWGTVKTSMKDAYSPIFEKFKSDEIQMNANGTRYVNKSGVTAISEGEMIIPSEMNPFYGDAGKKSKQSEINNEKKIKGNFSDQLSRMIFEGIDENAKGNIQKFNKGTQKKTKFQMPEELNILEKGLNNLGEGFNSVMSSLFKDTDGKASKDALAKTTKIIQDKFPDAFSSGLLGGAIGFATGLTGPLVGAAAGAAISFATKSEGMQNYLFGKMEYDNDGNEIGRSGGLVSKSNQEFLNRFLPDLKTYGIAGTVTGLITPFGPIGGLMMGSALAYAKNNSKIQEVFFGAEGGLINDKRKQLIKDAVPNMAVSTLGSLFFGPFGLMGNAALGAGIGLISTTDTFKDTVLGKPDKDGKRNGGIVGVLRTSVINPLTDFGKSIKDDVFGFINKDIIKPAASIIPPLLKRIELGTKAVFNGVGKTLDFIFKSTLGIPLEHLVRDYLVKPISSISKTIFGKLLKPAKFLLSAPSKLLEFTGNRMKRSDVKAGNADYMSADERLEFRRKQGMGEDKLSKFDEMLSGSTKEQLDTMSMSLEDIKKYKNAMKYEKEDAIKELGGGVSKYLDSSSKRKTVIKLIQQGRVEEAQKIIFEKNNLSKKDRDDLSRLITEKGEQFREINNREKNYTASHKELFARLNEHGIEDINYNNIDKYTGLLNTERVNKRFNEIPDYDKSTNQGKQGYLGIMGEKADVTNTFLQEMVDILKNIRDGELRDTAFDKKERRSRILGKFEKRKQDNKYNKTLKERQADIEELYGEGSLDENSRAIIGDTKSSKYNQLLSMNKDYKFKDVNKLLSYDPKSYEKIVNIAKLGYDIKDYDKVAKLSDKEYSNILQLSKMGYDFNADNFDRLKKVSDHDLEFLEDMSKIGITDSNFDTEDLLRLKSKRHLITKDPEAFKSTTLPLNTLKPEGDTLSKYITPEEKSKFIETEDGLMEMEQTSDGSYKPKKTKDTMDILNKKEERDETQKGILSKISDMSNGFLAWGKGFFTSDDKKEKEPWWKRLLNLFIDGGVLFGALTVVPKILKHLGDGQGIMTSLIAGIGDGIGALGKFVGLSGKDGESSIAAKASQVILRGEVKTGGAFAKHIPTKLLRYPLLGVEYAGKKMFGNTYVAEKVAKMTGGNKAGKLLTDAGKDVSKKVMENGKVASILAKATEFFTNLSSKIISFLPKGAQGPMKGLFKSLLVRLPQLIGKSLVKFTAALATGGLFNLVDGLQGFITGYQDADSIFGVTDGTTVGMKLCAATLRATNNVVFLGLIPDKLLMTAIVEYLGPYFGFNMSDIQKLRTKSENEVATYNKDNNTDFSIEQYNKTVLGKKNMWDYVGDSLGKLKDSVGATVDDWSSLPSRVSDIIGLVGEGDPIKLMGYGSDIKSMTLWTNVMIAKLGLMPLTSIIGTGKIVANQYNKLVSNIGNVKFTEDIQWFGEGATDIFSTKFWNHNLSNGDGFFSGLAVVTNYIDKILMSPVLMVTSVINNVIEKLGFAKDWINENSPSWLKSLMFDDKPKDIMDKLEKEKLEKEKAEKEAAKNANKKDENGLLSRFKRFIGWGDDTATAYGSKNNSKTSAQNSLSSPDSSFKFFSQVDGKYSNMGFNSPTDSITQRMKDSGCGPMAAANTVSAINGSLTPQEASRIAIEGGYKKQNAGTSPDYFRDVLGRQGIVTNYENSSSGVMRNLSSGNPVIFMGQDKNGNKSNTPYGENPHYIVGTGVRDGKIVVQDSESKTPNILYDAKNILNNSNVAISARGGFGSITKPPYKIEVPKVELPGTNDNDPFKKAKSISSIGEKDPYGIGSNLKNTPMETIANNVAAGLIETGVEGATDSIARTTNPNERYLSIGMSQWEGSRATNILKRIPGGEKFISAVADGSLLNNTSLKDELKTVLKSKEGETSQAKQVQEDCLEMYFPEIAKITPLSNVKVIIYLGMWCPTNHVCVRRLMNKNINNIDVNDLEAVSKLFEEKYYIEADVGSNIYVGRAKRTYEYCKKLPNTLGNTSLSGISGGTNAPKDSGIIGRFAEFFAKELGAKTEAFTNPLMNAFNSEADKRQNPLMKALFGDMGSSNSSSGSPGSMNTNNTSNNPALWLKDNLKYDITSQYGIDRGGGRKHHGVDYGTPEGTPIPSPISGKIFYNGNRDAGYGNAVSVLDKNDNEHLFAHMQSLSPLSVGTVVKKGDIVGHSGNTGIGTGPHLHYEIMKRTDNMGSKFDPNTYDLTGLGSKPINTNSPGMNIHKSDINNTSIKPNSNNHTGGPSDNNYTEILANIVKLLVVIAENTGKLQSLDSELTKIEGGSPSSVPKVNNAELVSSIFDKASRIFTGSKNGTGDAFANKDITNIVKTMDIITAQ